MSSTYHSAPTSTSFSPQPHDQLGLNNRLLSNTTSASTLLSSNSSQTYSNPATPSHNTDSTPAESLPEDISYSLGELDQLDDDFQGVNFDAGVQRVYSIPVDLLGGVEDYQAAEFDHPLPHLPPHPEDELSFQSLDNTAYPLSPSTTSVPNTPYYRNGRHKVGESLPQSQSKIEQQKSRLQPLTPPTQRNAVTGQLTPSYSAGSKGTPQVPEPRNMAARGNHLGDPEWDHQQIRFQSNTSMYPDGHYENSSHSDYFGPQLASQPGQQFLKATGVRDDEGRWESSESTGQAGIGPEGRKSLSGVEIPNLKEQGEQQRIAGKNVDIQEWRSHASGSSETLDETPGEGVNLPEVDDAASIRENRLVEGQTYYHVKNEPLTEADSLLMRQPRHWNDAPSLPYTTTTNFQPPTANDAIRKWQVSADAISLSSRVATWGTRRRSEPSLSDIDAIADGSFLKKLSISKPKETDRQRSNSILDQGLNRLARWSVSGRSKRSRSPEHSSSLRHSLSTSKKSTPIISTTPSPATGVNHQPSISVPARTSPKSSPHLGFRKSFIQRARSRSELSHHDKIVESGLVDLWSRQGGPPVPSLSSPPMEVEPAKPRAETHDQDEEDEEDDEQGEENDVGIKSEQQAEPIVPNYAGFKDHVRRLNPTMDLPECNWLVSRIGRQQETRYKTLLELRANHFRAVMAHTCSSKNLCRALNGSGPLLDVKGYSTQPDRNASELQLVTEFSDDSVLADGALTSETFHPGIPMPPTRTLPAEFECQICFKAKKFGKPSDWTKHVHEDLQPFTCTFNKCKEPKSFKRKADWVRHENERHRRLEWWKCELKDCDHVCYRKDNFLQHLVREHKYSEPRQKTKAAIKKAHAVEPAWDMLEQCHHETSERPQDEPCKFCGKTFNSWKKLMVHHGKHMEQISLPILQLVEGATVDATTIISPVDQNPTPITPVARQKMEPASPFAMANIPLHGPAVPRFTPPYVPATTPSSIYGMTAQMPHDVDYNSPMMYPDPLSTQPMGQPQSYNYLNPGGMGNLNEANTFLPTDAEFSSNLPLQGYGNTQSTGYSIPTSYASAAPGIQDYQSQYMLPMTDPSLYDLDSIGPTDIQGFQGVPRSRPQGNGPSYGYSPQNVPRYYGQPQ